MFGYEGNLREQISTRRKPGNSELWAKKKKKQKKKHTIYTTTHKSMILIFQGWLYSLLTLALLTSGL